MCGHGIDAFGTSVVPQDTVPPPRPVELPEKPQPREPVPRPQPPPIAVSPGPSRAQCDGVETFVGKERRCLMPKDSFRDCPTCPEMVVVPAGTFTMGSPEN